MGIDSVWSQSWRPHEGGAGKKEEINRFGDIIYSGMRPILMVRIHTGVNEGEAREFQG